MMELDELKAAWQSLNQRLETVEASQLDAMKELKLTGVRSALSRFAVAPAVDLVLGVLTALLTGSFLGNNWQDMRFFVPGLVLHVFVVLQIVSSVRQLVIIGTVDYAAPVLAIQRRLGEARALRIRTTQWALLLAPLLWTPLAIVAAKALLRLDVYSAFGLAYLLWNIGFGVVAIGVILLIAHRYADYFSRSPTMRRLADDAGGRNLSKAIAFLDDLKRFERE